MNPQDAVSVAVFFLRQFRKPDKGLGLISGGLPDPDREFPAERASSDQTAAFYLC